MCEVWCKLSEVGITDLAELRRYPKRERAVVCWTSGSSADRSSGYIILMSVHYAPDSVPPARPRVPTLGAITRSQTRVTMPESMVSEEMSCGAAPLQPLYSLVHRL